MKAFVKKKSLSYFFPFLLFVIGFVVHFIFIWHPNQVVFDEVHYGKAVNGYLSGKYFFTGHPPLGPQLITIGAWLTGYRNTGFSFDHIGQEFPNPTFIALRFMPALAGTLLPLVIYFLLLMLKLPASSAFVGALLLNLDNALIAESQRAFPNPFIILFGLLGITFFLYARQKKYKLTPLLLSGVFLGASLAAEWTAASFFVFVAALLLRDFVVNLRGINPKRLFKKLIKFISLVTIFGLTIFFVYFTTFQIHFALLPKEGTGDAFMSDAFREGKLSAFEKFIELNSVSYRTNLVGIKSQHPYGSKWYTWPFMQRSIFYWNGEGEKIYLLGNPILWWGGGIAMVIFTILFFLRKWWQEETASLLLVGYITTYLPFVPVKRVLFLYHYFAPLIFAITIMIFLINKIPSPYRRYLLLLMVIAVVISFLYFAPLTYGLKLSDGDFQKRLWLETWR